MYYSTHVRQGTISHRLSIGIIVLFIGMLKHILVTFFFAESLKIFSRLPAAITVSFQIL